MKTVSLGASLLSLSTMEAGRCKHGNCPNEALPGSSFCKAHAPIKAASPEIRMQTEERLEQEQREREAGEEQKKLEVAQKALRKSKEGLACELRQLQEQREKLTTLLLKIKEALLQSAVNMVTYAEGQPFYSDEQREHMRYLAQ